MISDYKESLVQFYQVDMLNEKGLKEYILILKDDLYKLREKIINLESDSSYKRSVLSEKRVLSGRRKK
jgi:hypothetical protein